jgi:lipoprotein-anchoring transpeptidase ErfK/SrfK
MTRLPSRRDFLKLSGATALSLAPSLAQTTRAAAEKPIGLGRVTNAALRAYDKPEFTAKAQKKNYWLDTLVNIYEENPDGDPGASQNPIWWRTDEGWVHSSLIQPVANDLNQPILDAPKEGFLAEITVPFSDAWRNDDGNPKKAYRFYYASTHWVDKVVTDKKGRVWYRVLDDRYQVYYFVLAESLRRVTADELTPLSLNVTDKLIEVSLKQQALTAYENSKAVFSARVSTGRRGSATPAGKFKVESKRPSRHMAATDGNGFDLPGVPWAAYIFWTGVAFHGTYWHNDYGTPRSRGCINLTPADAKWLYRWTLPIVPAGEDYIRAAEGTPVLVT